MGRKEEQAQALGYKKRWGDRRDGRRLRQIDGMHAYMPFLMKNRCDAEVYINEEFDLTELAHYLERKNGPDAPYKMTMFHVCVAAISKVVRMRPYLNRYIAGKRMYQRDRMTVAFVAKRRFVDHSEEALMILECKDDMTVQDIGRKIVGDVHQAREAKGGTADAALDILKKLPRFLVSLFVWFQRVSDYWDFYPRVLVDADTNFVSVLVSNLGSIKCGAPYHHLQNFGTNGVVVTIGEMKEKFVLQTDGTTEKRVVCDFGFTLDERIGDGFYFARSVKLYEWLLQHPEMLEKQIQEEIPYEPR